MTPHSGGRGDVLLGRRGRLDGVVGVDGVDVRVLEDGDAVVPLLVHERHGVPPAAEDDHLRAGHRDLPAFDMVTMNGMNGTALAQSRSGEVSIRS